MQIRGIDFARHTVVVSSGDAEPGPSALPGANQGRAGELLARVVGLVGGEATLELNGQRIVVQTHVPLALGERLFLKAEEGADGQIRLSIQGRQAGADGAEMATKAGSVAAAPEEALMALLDELGLPSDLKGQNLARALIARDGTLDTQAMRRLLVDLRGQAKVGPQEAGAAALLQKAEVAVNAQSMAMMMQRPQPDGGAQLGPALQKLQSQLQAYLRQGPSPGPAKALAQELTGTLKGLPLALPAQAERVAEGLRQWLGRLDPMPRGASPVAQAKAVGLMAPPAGGATAAAQGQAAPQGAKGEAPSAALGQALAGEGDGPAAAALPKATEALLAKAAAANPGLLLPLPEGAEEDPGPELLARLLAKVEGRPGQPEGEEAAKAQAAQAKAAGGEDATAGRRPARESVPELGKQLESLAKALGEQAPAPLRQALREAVAELRYTQLVNQVPVPPPQGMQMTPVAYLVPLVAPQLNPEQPIAQLQVHHKPKKPGDPIDPNNLRLLIALPTEHLDTVHIEVVVKDGVVDLNLGLDRHEDRAMVSQRLPELQAAVAQLGWPIGRFAAKTIQPQAPLRQELNLAGELHHVDRRV